jgi:1,2-diacylglycerol 3-alpha-glucosyltransferase
MRAGSPSSSPDRGVSRSLRPSIPSTATTCPSPSAYAIVDDEVRRIVEFYSNVDEVWVPQPSVGKTLREYGYKGRIDTMENGIDFSVPADISPYRKRGAELFGFGEEIFMGLYVGQHIEAKNLELLVNSLKSICEGRPDFRMVFLGDGYFKPHMKTMVERMGLADRVVFRDVIRDRELLKSIYARGDLLLFPSVYDNAPLVLREAAAFRTPAVLVENSDAAEVIRSGENGFTAENDLEAFAATVIDLVGDPERVRLAGENASKSLCRSWENVVAEARNRYIALIGSKTGAKSVIAVPQAGPA